jgi:hypothetical protein
MPFNKPATTTVETKQLRQLLKRTKHAKVYAKELFKVVEEIDHISAVNFKASLLTTIADIESLTKDLLGLKLKRPAPMD